MTANSLMYIATGALFYILVANACNLNIHMQKGMIITSFSEEEIEKMLRMGFIETKNTEWASSIVFLPKNNGTQWLGIYYWKLNTVTVTDSYLLPFMDSWIEYLGDTLIFATLDAKLGYW